MRPVYSIQNLHNYGFCRDRYKNLRKGDQKGVEPIIPERGPENVVYVPKCFFRCSFLEIFPNLSTKSTLALCDPINFLL